MSAEHTYEAAHYLIGVFRGLAHDRPKTWIKRLEKKSWLAKTEAMAVAEKIAAGQAVDNPLKVYEMEATAKMLGFKQQPLPALDSISKGNDLLDAP